MKQSPISNGWTDKNESKSNISELFAKLVLALKRLKQKRGDLCYPHQPLYPDLNSKPSAIIYSKKTIPTHNKSSD